MEGFSNMTRFFPSSCHCIIDIPDNPYDESKSVFVERCKTHPQPIVTFIHNRSFKKRPTESEQDLELRRNNEKARPAFQRDPNFKRT